MVRVKVVMMPVAVRTVVAFVLFAVLASGSIGVVGLVQAESERGLPLESIRLPEPRIGDVAQYERVRPNGNISSWSMTWLEPRWVPDRSGEFHRVNPLAVSVEAFSRIPDRVEILSQSVTHYDVETGHSIGSSSLLDWNAASDSMLGHGLQGEVYQDRTEELSTERSNLQGPFCWATFQGTMRLDAPIHQEHCRGPFPAPKTAWRAVAAGVVDDVSYVVLEAEGSTGGWRSTTTEPWRLVLRDDLPYPVLADYGSRSTYILRGFAPGSVPLESGPYVRPAPLPPLEDLPLGPYGLPDERGIDHPWPLSEAFAELRAEEPELRAFLAEHEGARIHTMALINERSNDPALEWYWILSDGDQHYHACIRKGTIGTGILLELIDDVVPRTSCSRGHFQDADRVAPDRVTAPSVASLLAAWQTYADTMQIETDGIVSWSVHVQARNWTSHTLCSCGEVRVGVVEIEKEDLHPLDSSVVGVRFDSLYYVDDDLIQAHSHHRHLQRNTPTPLDNEAGEEAVIMMQSYEDPPVWLLPPLHQALAMTFIALMVAFLYWAFPWLKHGLVTGLFSRISKDGALDHKVREDLLAAVEAEPGIHDRALQRRLGLARGQMHHHLDKLVATGILTRRQSGRYTGYWPPGQADHFTVERAVVLKTPLAKQIAEALDEDPGLSSTVLAERLGKSRQSVDYHVKRLRSLGLSRTD